MRRCLQELNWDVLEALDVESTWTKIKEVIEENVQKHVPQHKNRKTCQKATPWWTKALMKEVKLKHALCKDYTRVNTPESYRIYTEQRNKTTHLLRKARRKYESDIIKQGKENPKRIHTYIRATYNSIHTEQDFRKKSNRAK